MPESDKDKVVEEVGHVLWLVSFVRKLNLRGLGHIALQLSGVVSLIAVAYVAAGEPGGVNVPVGEKADIINPVAGSPGIQTTAFDVCEDDNAEVVRYSGIAGIRNPRYEVHLKTTEEALDPQNNPTGLKRDVRYDLTMQIDGDTVAVDETRAGFTAVHRSEVVTDGLKTCLSQKAKAAPEEIR